MNAYLLFGYVSLCQLLSYTINYDTAKRHILIENIKTCFRNKMRINKSTHKIFEDMQATLLGYDKTPHCIIELST